ncbi:MAG TPA: ABC transporter ATP-binding protein [Oscillospiraceae bacterium]|nr:ABC transporter ATP-binding protein [Oscillospiraceae bacterium]
MLQIKNLNFFYRKRQVLHNINITVEKGEILGLVGPNGSGKSTLLRCLNGSLLPDSGEILLHDEDIQNKKCKWISRHIAFLPQHLEAVGHITVYELVTMGRSPYSQFGWFLTVEDRDKVAWAIDYLDLRSIQHRPLDRISGGERQRAWIAMILAQDTEVILLDEPITFLDLKYQWDLLNIIKKIRQQYRKTFILVLHDLNQAMTIADNFVVLKEGRISAQGQPQDVITSHLLKKVYDVAATVCDFADYDRPIVLPAKTS